MLNLLASTRFCNLFEFHFQKRNHRYEGGFGEMIQHKMLFPLARNLFSIFSVKTQISKGKSVPSLKGATNKFGEILRIMKPCDLEDFEGS